MRTTQVGGVTDSVATRVDVPVRVLAEEALDLAFADPDRAAAPARQVARRAGRERDPAAMSIAARAQAVAARDQNQQDLAAAGRYVRRAVQVAAKNQLTELAGAALTTSVSILYLLGRPSAALQAADRAAALVTGHDLAVLDMQRANILMWQGQSDRALIGYAAALNVFRRTGDQRGQAMVHSNRGLLHLNASSLTAAMHDLLRAEDLYSTLGDQRSTADVRQHLGLAAARRGDLASALSWFDSADEVLSQLHVTDPLALLDRVEALLSARLVAEARQVIDTAIDQLRRRRRSFYLPQARLMLGEVALLQGDPRAAGRAATQARQAFVRQGQTSHVALCDYLRFRATSPEARRRPSGIAKARLTADALAAAGWNLQALDARLMTARLALDLGRQEEAMTELRKCNVARRRGPVALRSRAWHATALLRLAAGDRRGARSAVRAGLRVISHYQATLAATELRVYAAEHGADLASLGLTLALDDTRADRILAWSERWRARTLLHRPVRAPVDDVLAERLDRLRQINQQMEEAARVGRDTRRLERRVVTAEEAVRQRARLAQTAGSRLTETTWPEQIRQEIGTHALIEYIESDGVLSAVVVTDRRSRWMRLGDVGAVQREIQLLNFALRRLTRTHLARVVSIETARRGAAYSGQRLFDLLLRPMVEEIGDRPLVIVPTATLHSLPWPAVPSLGQRRPLSVAPSATQWFGSHTAAAGALATTVLAAGPGLPYAEQEVNDLARMYPARHVLTGADAGVGAVLRALDGADLGHIAAHGRFRSDNALFSYLRLHDGPMTVYDVEGLEHAPACLIIAACDVGLSDVRAGDELIGVAGALLSMGTRTVIATSLPVPDDQARRLMLALHRRLHDGESPATALAGARTDVEEGPGPLCGFLCFGAG